MVNAELSIVINARDKTRSVFTGLKGGIAGVAGAMKNFVASGIQPLMLALGAGGLAYAVKTCATSFGDLEQAVVNAASVTGAQGTALVEVQGKIENIARTLGATTIYSATEVAAALYDLASAGYDMNSITADSMSHILDLAAATQSDLPRATEIATAAMGQFSLGFEDSQRVVDALVGGITSSKATLDKLGLSFRMVGPVAKSVGYEIEDLVGILGALYNAGFTGSTAGTALRAIFARLMSPTSEAARVLAKYGITLESISPETNSFASILKTLQAAGISTSDAFEIFGVEAASAAQALISNADATGALMDEVSDLGGVAERVADVQLDTYQGKMKLVESSISDLKISIGEKLMPTLLAFAEILQTEILPNLDKLADYVTAEIDTTGIKEFGSALHDAIVENKDDLLTILDAIIAIINAMSKAAGFFGEKIGGIGERYELLKALPPGGKPLSDVDVKSTVLTDTDYAAIERINAILDFFGEKFGGLGKRYAGSEEPYKILAFPAEMRREPELTRGPATTPPQSVTFNNTINVQTEDLGMDIAAILDENNKNMLFQLNKE